MDKTDTCGRFSLQYVTDLDAGATFELIKGELEKTDHNFNIRKCCTLSKACRAIQSAEPDLVVVECESIQGEKIKKTADNIKSQCKGAGPAIFIILPLDPGAKGRKRIMEAGYDEYFIKPFSPVEFTKKAGLHIGHKRLVQTNKWQKNNLDRALEENRQFEKRLLSVRQELFDERDVLNNSLKQINLMTKERDKLKEDMALADKELQENLTGFARLLCTMIESKVEKNRGHSFRVAEISLFLAEEMKLSEEKKDQLHKAALLHETGKLLISQLVLDKNEDDLTGNEKDFFLHYPEKGAKLLEMCPGFGKIADIVKYQNENVDGSGNPEGLRRKYIPLQSRMLAGANLFDELRCQQNISCLDDLFEKLEENAGSRLDPKIVNYLEKYAVTRLGNDFGKVKGIGIHQLEKGMKLGTALFTSSGTKLFSANTLLDHEAIEKILKYNRKYPVDETIYIKV